MKGLYENLEKPHSPKITAFVGLKKIFLFEQIYFTNIVAW